MDRSGAVRVGRAWVIVNNNKSRPTTNNRGYDRRSSAGNDVTALWFLSGIVRHFKFHKQSDFVRSGQRNHLYPRPWYN
jgi:hypothetical protein